jgi:predicted Zn-dependent peptidase
VTDVAHLTNGIPVLVDRVDGAEVAAVGIWIAGGARAERGDEGGLAHAVEHIVMRHRSRNKGLSAAEQLDAWGGEADGETAKEHIAMFARVPVGRAADAAAVLANSVTAVVESAEWESERRVLLEEVRGLNETSWSRATDQLFRIMYPDQPFGLSTAGSAGAISAATTGAIDRFRRAIVHAGTVGVVCAGSVDADAMATAIEATPLGGLEPRKPPNIVPAMIRDDRIVSRVGAPDPSAAVCIGGSATAVGSAERLIDDVAVAVLVGSSGSRIHRDVRTRAGLVYAVGGHASHYSDTGIWRACVATDDELAEDVLGLIESSLAALAADGPTGEELAAAREFTAGQQRMLAETTVGRMSGIGHHCFINGLDAWSSAADIAAIADVDLERVGMRVVELARTWSAAVVAGPSVLVS